MAVAALLGWQRGESRAFGRAVKLLQRLEEQCRDLRLSSSPPSLRDLLPRTAELLREVAQAQRAAGGGGPEGPGGAVDFLAVYLANLEAKGRQVVALLPPRGRKTAADELFREGSRLRRQLAKLALIFSHMHEELSALFPGGKYCGNTYQLTKIPAHTFWRKHCGARYIFRPSCTRLGQWAIGYVSSDGSILQTIPLNKPLFQALLEGQKEGFYLYPDGKNHNPDLTELYQMETYQRIHVSEEQLQLYWAMDSTFELCKICAESNKDVKIEPCGHLLCGRCLAAWQQSDSQTCPFCRCEIKGQEAVSIHQSQGRPEDTSAAAEDSGDSSDGEDGEEELEQGATSAPPLPPRLDLFPRNPSSKCQLKVRGPLKLRDVKVSQLKGDSGPPQTSGPSYLAKNLDCGLSPMGSHLQPPGQGGS
ncbi:E3 ubiquitin-protein ligase CBL-C isoform X5 [Camelus dromedarius]|uniref:E3 ubiquitin-protein ligase CBL-C isoform X5 n=1 Tax=Camelus dromedarius TaxID=9838 RepID=UPI0012639050|nr:E3 ubiquitin-protein ligase CBL-C isoform X5 [Camelus dromedarius]